jgi:hypothetical protein
MEESANASDAISSALNQIFSAVLFSLIELQPLRVLCSSAVCSYLVDFCSTLRISSMNSRSAGLILWVSTCANRRSRAAACSFTCLGFNLRRLGISRPLYARHRAAHPAKSPAKVRE